MTAKNISVILFTLLVLITFWLYKSYEQSQLPEGLNIFFLDVGQGDATLIRTPQGNDILIDGGPDDTLIRKLGRYLPFFDRTIELMILTHPDNDHVAGLVEVLKRYQTQKILLTGVLDNSPSYLAFLEAANKSGTAIEIVASPKIINLDSQVYFDIIFPDKSFESQLVESTNNTSIVGKLIYASTSVMLTGDLEIEEELVNGRFDLKSDIYHVGHHGANNANAWEFILAVQPAYAVISVGADNRYGHPQYRTLKNLDKLKIPTLRTDQKGDIVFNSDGHYWQLLDP